MRPRVPQTFRVATVTAACAQLRHLRTNLGRIRRITPRGKVGIEVVECRGQLQRRNRFGVVDNPSDVGGQVLAAGLVDEVRMDVVPVVFGSGKRYFGSLDAQHLLEGPDVAIQGNRVLHLRYRVRR